MDSQNRIGLVDEMTGADGSRVAILFVDGLSAFTYLFLEPYMVDVKV